MAKLGCWTTGTTSLTPSTTWINPTGMFGTEERNDNSTYSFNDTVAQVTMPIGNAKYKRHKDTINNVRL